MTAAPSESWEQGVVVEQLRVLGILCASIPNDAPRTTLGHVQAKRRGLTAGAPDLLIFAPPPAFPWARGVALEFKKRSTRERAVARADEADGAKALGATPDQLKFLADLEKLGWKTAVVAGAPAALAFLKELGYPVATVGPPTA